MTAATVFSSESVTKGHPDKLCDTISDTIIDAYLFQDPLTRASVECAIASGVLFIAARAGTEASLDLPSAARQAIAAAGYTGDGFDARNCAILTSMSQIPRQSAPTHGVDDDPDSLAASDHVNAFGYACRETENLLPAPIHIAHSVARLLDSLRESGEAPFLAPDGKAQAAVAYLDGRPSHVHGVTVTVALSGKELSGSGMDALEGAIAAELTRQPVPFTGKGRVVINPGDAQRVGGPAHHAGLTGRKTAIDTYGEYARHSSAALSGKDPYRIDRAGPYAARHAAVNLVAAGLAERCEVHLAYGIGRARPASIAVNSFGTGAVSDETLAMRLTAATDFRPLAIIRRLGLSDIGRQPGEPGFYRHLAVYGHMGRTDLDAPWERRDLAEALRD